MSEERLVIYVLLKTYQSQCALHSAESGIIFLILSVLPAKPLNTIASKIKAVGFHKR